MSDAMGSSSSDRDQLAIDFLASLPYPPYPMQEEALLAWFTSSRGVLVCAPTGTGKTLIAEAAVYEALRTNRICYYTTPLIALTEQKFCELQARATAWGFPADDVGLVTGHRRINPGAKVLVVVAEILLNRLLNPNAFDFGFVESVVMDEFHSFNDPERGIVWEMTLGLLPSHVRTLLLSATVGNAYEFSAWLRNSRKRDLQLVQSTERRVPLTYHWIPDQFVTEQLEIMARGDEAVRLTPSLVFCFNREECWNVADQLRGKKLLAAGQQNLLDYELRKYDLSEGAGPKLRQLLLRGVGVHHAGVLPKYRRIVEDLFERKLLSVVVCTETLAAGINLPARSVVLPSLVKGAPDRRRLIDASSAHQMFGRAGRPQFDSHGHVVALPHEDDVKIARWKEQYDRIPDNSKDPGLIRAKKAMAKKAPKRRSNETYWSEANFQALVQAVPGKLASRGRIPWRLLGHILEITSDLSILRDVVGSRLMPPHELEAGQRHLDQMLLTLWRAGYLRLEPAPPSSLSDIHSKDSDEPAVAEPSPSQGQLFGQPLRPTASTSATGTRASASAAADTTGAASHQPAAPRYRAERAYGTELLPRLQRFRSVNPLYGVFLTQQLGIADRAERLQALESVLGFPGSIARYVRVPPLWDLPPGALATGRLDELLLRMGIISAEQLTGTDPKEDCAPEDRIWPLKFAEKLQLLFAFDFPEVDDIVMEPVWVAGAILEFGGNFNKFVLHRRMQRQEGLVLRHLLRLILLLNEFAPLAPPDCDEADWKADLNEIQSQIVATCQAVDADSTQKTLDDVATSLRDEL